MHKGVVLDDKTVDFIGSMMPVLNEKQRRLFLAKISDYYGSIRSEAGRSFRSTA